MFQARRMRQAGESLKQIATSLHVSVSSVSTWCRGIELTQEQIENLQKRIKDPNYGKKLAYLKQQKKLFNEKIQKLKEEGKKEVGRLSERDVFIAGIALYWGEGFKKDHLVGLATSDPNAARFYIYWLEKCFGITKENLIVRVTSNILYKPQIEKLHSYWIKILGLSMDQISKPYFQKTIWKKEYINKDEYHGVIRIKVRKSINLLRKIYGYIEGFIEGF